MNPLEFIASKQVSDVKEKINIIIMFLKAFFFGKYFDETFMFFNINKN